MMTDLPADARGSSPPWAELPADALREIAGHLHDAGDLVRFLAVCRPRREAPLPPRAPSFLPCLVESYGSLGDPAGVRLYSAFSTRKTRTQPFLPFPALRGKMLERSGASSGRVLAVGRSSGGMPTADLINQLNGEFTSLPPRPRSEWRSASCGVSRSGVVVSTGTCTMSWPPSCCGPARRKSA